MIHIEDQNSVWYDVEKITEAVPANITYNGYDIAIPTYIDHAFGVPPLGGEITIPEKFGIAAGPTDNKPVRTKANWPRVKKLLIGDPNRPREISFRRNESSRLDYGTYG